MDWGDYLRDEAAKYQQLMLPRGPVGQIAHCVMVVTYTGVASI